MKDIENKTTHQPENTNKHFHITCRLPVIRFFKGWLFLGVILMLLNATIWPEISADANIRWFYQAATLWLTMINEICKFVFPYLQNAGNWLTNAAIWLIGLVINIFEWCSANWQPILATGIEIVLILLAIFKFLFKIWIYTIILLLLFLAVLAIVFVVTYFIDKDKAFKLWNEFKAEVIDEIIKTLTDLFKDNKASDTKNQTLHSTDDSEIPVEERVLHKTDENAE